MALPALAASVTQPRQVLLVRHAHAEEPRFDGTDFDRPLSPRGEQDALRTAQAIRAKSLVPTLILASPARRTRQTAEIIARELGTPVGGMQFVESLYNGSSAVLETELRQAAVRVDGLLLLVAHNPGISQLARGLSPGTPSFSPADWRLTTLG